MALDEFFAKVAEGLTGKRNGDTAPPKKVLAADAVRAAVQVMNKMETPGGSDIMGENNIEMTPGKRLVDIVRETDALLCKAGQLARSNPAYVGFPRMVRLGLLMDDWISFRQRLCAIALAAEAARQETHAFHDRALGMADDVVKSVRIGRAMTATYSRIPWKSFFISTGIFASGLFGFLWWRGRRQTTKSSLLED